MLEGLRRKLVVLCTVTTEVIAAAMAVVILLLTENLVMKQAEAEFVDVFRSVQYALERQESVSYRWLSQTEFNYGIQLHIEQNGMPLRYMRERQVNGATSILEQAIAFTWEDSAALIPQCFIDRETGTAYYIGGGELQGASARTRLYVAKSLAEVQAGLSWLRLSVWGVGVAVLCLLGLFSWWFVSRLLRPIEESRRRQADFIASASHELRTPLAVIRTGIGAIRKAPPEQADHFLHLISREENRMSRLVDELLLLAGADSGMPETQLRKEACEMEPLLISVCERFEQVARDKGVRLTLSLPDEILPRCHIDFERIEQALSVLLDNAICYTPEGGEVQISAAAEQCNLTISVRDNGVGIPVKHRPYIFDRFYRADDSRTGREHLGLGLSIAKEIAELHYGSVQFQDAQPGGSEFLLFLPYN